VPVSGRSSLPESQEKFIHNCVYFSLRQSEKLRDLFYWIDLTIDAEAHPDDALLRQRKGGQELSGFVFRISRLQQRRFSRASLHPSTRLGTIAIAHAKELPKTDRYLVHPRNLFESDDAVGEHRPCEKTSTEAKFEQLSEWNRLRAIKGRVLISISVFLEGILNLLASMFVQFAFDGLFSQLVSFGER